MDTETEPKTEPKTETPPPKEEARNATVIDIGETGSLTPKNHNQLFMVARQLIMGKAVPKWFTTPEAVYAAMNYAASLNLPPQPSLSNIAMVQGVPSIFGDLPLALAQRTDEIESHEEFVFDENYNKICYENKNLNAKYIGATCVIKRKGREVTTESFTIEDAKKAGLWEMKSSTGSPMPWSLYPKTMLIRRARSALLKRLFPDALRGARITEYDDHQAPDLRDVTPTSTSSYITDTFGSTASPAVAPEEAPGPVKAPGPTLQPEAL
jgi:RecT family